MSYNTRIAPSPTGDMHLGTARTAYFNWLAARATKGSFILRIDDTDLDRNDESKVNDIFEIMDWLSLDFDATYRQSDNLDKYLAAANQLIDSGYAIRRDDGSIHLMLLIDFFDMYWTDKGLGQMKVSKSDMDFINTMTIIKSNGYPVYNFASVVDDLNMGINFVIRGTDHILNTAKQHILIQLLTKQKNDTLYQHVGLLHQNGKKLSKRDSAASMLEYKRKGYDPDAVLNFLLRLGWGPTVDDKSTKTIDKAKALELFLDQGSMKASSANIDLQKLDSFDRKYKAKRS